jgi:serine/threonine protein kinase
MASSPNAGDRERILAELARRDAGESRDPLPPEEESTLAAFGAELETLVGDLRQPPPIDAFEDESGCRRAIELAEQVGLRSDSWPWASDAADDQEPALERVGPYRITARLGRGGMGAVYRAVHDKLKRVVAVKVLPAQRMKDAGAIARFEREMEAIGALNHPNIVTAHDAGEVDGMHYLVMECVEGLDLAALVRRAGPLPIADACEIVRQAAQGLKAAYDRGIVHRDLKPSNLMLAQGTPDHPEATVKVLDFGLARLAPLHAEMQDLTNSGQIMGTLKYMAPEQCSQSHAVDVRADIYSLGATLYKLLCGASPFSDERFGSPLALLAALGSEEPPQLAERRPDVPRKLEAIVHRMMAKKPGDRFASPGEVIEALASWTEGANLAVLLTRARDEKPKPQMGAFATARPLGHPAPANKSAGGGNRRFPALLVLLSGGALLVAAGLLLAPRLLDDWTPAARETRAGTPASSVPLVSSDPARRGREVAEWLLPRANEIEITTSRRRFATLHLLTGERLPDDFVQLITANLDENEALSDDDMAQFDKLPLFTSLSIGRTRIGDVGLRRLGQLPLLQMLFLSETAVTDASLDQLQRYPKLEVLHLTGTQVTDAGLVHLAGHMMLYDLSLGGCSISDAGLSHLTGLKRLRILDLIRTGVTPHGIATLQLSLPDCELRSDYSEDEIAAAHESIPKVLTQPEAR